MSTLIITLLNLISCLNIVLLSLPYLLSPTLPLLPLPPLSLHTLSLPLLQGAGDVALRALHLLWKLQDDAAAAQTAAAAAPATKKVNEVHA